MPMHNDHVNLHPLSAGTFLAPRYVLEGLAKAMGMSPKEIKTCTHAHLNEYVITRRGAYNAFRESKGEHWASGAQRQYASDIGVVGVDWDTLSKTDAGRMISEHEKTRFPVSQGQLDLINMLRSECDVGDSRMPVSKSQATRYITYLMWCKKGLLTEEHRERATRLHLPVPQADLARLNVPAFEEVFGQFLNDSVGFYAWYKSNKYRLHQGSYNPLD